MSIESDVDRGAVLLDEKFPGWWNQINVEKLRMEDCVQCILGQLYGHYIRGRDRLGLECGTGEFYGYDFRTYLSEYPDLQKAWIAEINSRKMVQQPSLFREVANAN